jgi:hypothetical protein
MTAAATASSTLKKAELPAPYKTLFHSTILSTFGSVSVMLQIPHKLETVLTSDIAPTATSTMRSIV